MDDFGTDLPDKNGAVRPLWPGKQRETFGCNKQCCGWLLESHPDIESSSRMVMRPQIWLEAFP